MDTVLITIVLLLVATVSLIALGYIVYLFLLLPQWLSDTSIRFPKRFGIAGLLIISVPILGYTLYEIFQMQWLDEQGQWDWSQAGNNAFFIFRQYLFVMAAIAWVKKTIDREIPQDNS